MYNAFFVKAGKIASSVANIFSSFKDNRLYAFFNKLKGSEETGGTGGIVSAAMDGEKVAAVAAARIKA